MHIDIVLAKGQTFRRLLYAMLIQNKNSVYFFELFKQVFDSLNMCKVYLNH